MKNILFVFVLYFYVLFAAELYVQQGANATTGCTLASPCGLILNAIAAAGSGDTIWVHPGTYETGYTPIGTQFGLPVISKDITLKSIGSQHNTFITGGTFYCKNSTFIVEGFTFSNSFYTFVTGFVSQSIYIFKVDNECHFKLKNSTIADNNFNHGPTSNQAIIDGMAQQQYSQTTILLDRVIIRNNSLTSMNGARIGSILYARVAVNITFCKFAFNTGYGLQQAHELLTVNDTYLVGGIETLVFIRATASFAIYRSNIHSTVTLSVRSPHDTFVCPQNPNAIIGQANNSFCGRNNSMSCNWPGGFDKIMLQVPDSCGVCAGDNSDKDCNGVCFGTTFSNCVAPPTWYVAPGANGNGLTRNSPLGNIQTAIDLASNGHQVMLLRGTYTGPGNVNLSFNGKRVKLTSEDKSNTDTIIDCQLTPGTFSFRANSSEHFDANVDSITIKRCTSPINITLGSSLSFTNVKFTENVNDQGGCIIAQGGGVIIKDSEFVSNSVTSVAPISTAGITTNAAVGLYPPTSLVITNSKFLNNFGGVNYFGAAISAGSRTTLKLINNVFVKNVPYFNYQGVQLFINQDVYSFIHNNSFFAESISHLAIQLEKQKDYPFLESGTTFCGGGSTASCQDTSCPNITSPRVITTNDECSVCNGHPKFNNSKDCKGDCWGYAIADNFGGCCKKTQRDCLDQCPATSGYVYHSLDINNTCCNTTDIHCSKCYERCCEPSCVNGVCDIISEPPQCDCGSSGFSGSTCESFTCESPCVHGTCVGPNLCSCTGAYFGPTCSEFTCAGGCENGGSCVAPNTCNCTGGYFGPTCSDFTCTPSCQNNGVCVAPNLCDCSQSLFTGFACHLCGEIECENGAGCIQIQYELNETLPNEPLSNETTTFNGTLSNETTTFNGTLSNETTSFNGTLSNQTTTFNGTLSNQTTTFNGTQSNGTTVTALVCSCINGYYGDSCAAFTCSPSCGNGGVCVAPNTCDCSNTGYSGANCSVPICDPTCVHGTCIAPDTCECLIGYSGALCDQGGEGILGESDDTNGNGRISRTVGIIIGVVFGVIGVAAIVLVVFFVAFYLTKKKERSYPQIQAFQLQVSLNYPSEGTDTQDSFKSSK